MNLILPCPIVRWKRVYKHFCICVRVCVYTCRIRCVFKRGKRKAQQSKEKEAPILCLECNAMCVYVQHMCVCMDTDIFRRNNNLLHLCNFSVHRIALCTYCMYELNVDNNIVLCI